MANWMVGGLKESMLVNSKSSVKLLLCISAEKNGEMINKARESKNSAVVADFQKHYKNL